MNLLNVFTSIIQEECKDAIKYSIFGTQGWHFESIERIEDQNGAFMFKVTTWNNNSTNSRKVKIMSICEIFDELGRAIAARGTTEAAKAIRTLSEQQG